MYTQEHKRLCKLCKTGLAAYFDCLYHYKNWSYSKLIAEHPEYHFNKVNLHNHFSASPTVSEFWGRLMKKYKGLDVEEEEMNLIRNFYGLPLVDLKKLAELQEDGKA